MEVIGRVKEHIKGSSSSLLLYNVSRTVLANNNSAQDIPSGRSGKNLRVPVLNMSGKPLMPTGPRKARILLKQGKATVVQRMPFTIQLKYPSGETKQDITLDINDRYSTIGFSAVTEKSELISGELTLRKGISKPLEQKRNYRLVRRNKLLHRKSRLNNRSKPKGWLASGIHHKLNIHLRLIEKLKEVLPITKVIVEVSAFDTQKLQNPEIKDVEYQQEELQGHEVIEYLLEKWKHKCAYCGKDDLPLEIEHIIPKSRGGSDRVSNLTLACHKCNQNKGDKTAAEFGHPEIQKVGPYRKKTGVIL